MKNAMIRDYGMAVMAGGIALFMSVAGCSSREVNASNIERLQMVGDEYVEAIRNDDQAKIENLQKEKKRLVKEIEDMDLRGEELEEFERVQSELEGAEMGAAFSKMSAGDGFPDDSIDFEEIEVVEEDAF